MRGRKKVICIVAAVALAVVLVTVPAIVQYIDNILVTIKPEQKPTRALLSSSISSRSHNREPLAEVSAARSDPLKDEVPPSCSLRDVAISNVAHFLPSDSVATSMYYQVPETQKTNNLLYSSPSSFPPCPSDERLRALDAYEADNNVDQKTSHILTKYHYYASRCNKTGGIMWKHLTPEVMEAVTQRVVAVVLRILSSQTVVNRRRDIHVLDWASGCGRGSWLVERSLRASQNVSSVRLLGIELIAESVGFSRSHFSRPSIQFCHADGTKLTWIPPSSIDLILSFGGLLHLPTALMCDTIAQLLQKLKPNGVMWTGYVDNYATAIGLMRCVPSASSLLSPGNVTTTPAASTPCTYPLLEVHLIKENVWWRNTGMPKVYRKKKPLSVIWVKRGW